MEYMEIILALCTILVSVGISWGIISTKIKQLETRVDKFDKDHDLLVELNTKIDMLLNKKDKK